MDMDTKTELHVDKDVDEAADLLMELVHDAKLTIEKDAKIASISYPVVALAGAGGQLWFARRLSMPGPGNRFEVCWYTPTRKGQLKLDRQPEKYLQPVSAIYLGLNRVPDNKAELDKIRECVASESQ